VAIQNEQRTHDRRRGQAQTRVADPLRPLRVDEAPDRRGEGQIGNTHDEFAGRFDVPIRQMIDVAAEPENRSRKCHHRYPALSGDIRLADRISYVHGRGVRAAPTDARHACPEPSAQTSHDGRHPLTIMTEPHRSPGLLQQRHRSHTPISSRLERCNSWTDRGRCAPTTAIELT
jgi:hypothetical protein